VNGYLQARALTTLHSYPDSWMREPCFVIGVLLFFLGMALNWQVGG
jgi:hypothetical protein